jgi:hypothetical protein
MPRLKEPAAKATRSEVNTDLKEEERAKIWTDFLEAGT